MRISVSFVMASLIAGTCAVVAAPAVAVEVCDDQFKRCEQGCDREKVAWLFKGKAYDQCVSTCETRQTACKAEDMDVDRFEVILPRSHYRNIGKDSQELPRPEDLEAGDATGG